MTTGRAVYSWACTRPSRPILNVPETPITDEPEARGPLSRITNIPVRAFPVLANRDFRFLWTGQIMGASAMWMEQVVRNWLTWEMTGSALQLGAVNFVRFVPGVVAGLLAGVLADRFTKKKLILVAQSWNLVVFAVMAWVVLSGHLQLWHLYVSAVALALGMSLREPVRAAYAPALVPPEHLLGALSLNATAMNGSRLLWPAVTGVLIATINPGFAYLTAVVFVLVMQVATLMIRFSDPPGDQSGRGSVGGDLIEGFRFVFGHRLLVGLLLSRFGPITIASGFQVLIPVFAVEVLGMGSGAYGALLSAEGLGAIIGGFTLASRREVKRPGMIMVVSGTVLSVLLMLGVLMTTFWGLWLLLVLIGMSQTTFSSSSNGAMFGQTPQHMRGRMVGVRNQTRSFTPAAQLGAGALAEAAGTPIVFGVLGALSLLVLWAVLLWRPEIRNA